jgi:hypothetical protein
LGLGLRAATTATAPVPPLGSAVGIGSSPTAGSNDGRAGLTNYLAPPRRTWQQASGMVGAGVDQR